MIRGLWLAWHFHDLRLPLVSDIRTYVPLTTTFAHHGLGVVIGKNVRLGERVVIYQQVTLGAKRYGERDVSGNVMVGNDVIIYPCSIVVGNITIGDGAQIGAHSFVSRDVAPGEIVAGVVT